MTVTLLVKQVELQLRRHHRVIAVGLEPIDHLVQQMPRVGHGGRHPLLRVHADLHRRCRYLSPRHALQAAAKRIGTAVDVADIPDQPGVFHVLAIDGQPENGARQRPTAFVDRQQLIAVQQLAPWHAVVVEDEQLEHLDIRVVLKKGPGFLQVGKGGRG
ncbi:hypothetical protein D3C75_1026350 [compost metagenome]